MVLNLFELVAHLTDKKCVSALFAKKHLKDKNSTVFGYFLGSLKIWWNTRTNSTAHMCVAAHQLRNNGIQRDLGGL